jgi:ribulose-5-phosphate 4-epimerase/fuculose-1-phosphate aldolase
MVINTTFNNISVISLRSVILVDKTGVLVETTDLRQVTDTLYHLMLYRLRGFELTTLEYIFVYTEIW